jgi:hypothetical protein
MWLARASVSRLITGLIGVLIALSLVCAALYVALEDAGRPAEYRGDRFRTVWLALASLRALLGVDDLPRQPDNAAHNILASIASLVGALVPALVLGVALIKLFATRAFQWRKHLNVCLAAELEGDLVDRVEDGRHGYLAIRWYKRLSNLSVVDLRADAYMRCRATSTVDGSTMYRYQRLKVLTLDGDEAESCTWPETFSGMPFTLWIPLHAPLSDGAVKVIQGRELTGTDREVVVRLSGRVAGLMTELSDEHRYHLVNDAQFGRFVPVEPDLNTPERRWRGWARFDEPLTHGLFVYGDLCHPEALLELLGHWPLPGQLMPARLRGFARRWLACADNTDPARPATYLLESGEEPAVQVLFLALKHAPEDWCDGLLVRIGAEQLAALDKQDGGYLRRNVTDSIELENPAQRADVVWTYVAGPAQEERVARAVATGTACLRREYLDHLETALKAHGLLDDLERQAPVPRLPVLRLTRSPAANHPVDTSPSAGTHEPTHDMTSRLDREQPSATTPTMPSG